MVHIESQPMASVFLAKLTTFSGLVSGAGLTQASPILAIALPFQIDRRIKIDQSNDPFQGGWSAIYDTIRNSKSIIEEELTHGCFYVQAQDSQDHRWAKSYSAGRYGIDVRRH